MPTHSHMQDAKYLDDKLRDLVSIAEDAITTLDAQVTNIEGNITELESIREEDLTAVHLRLLPRLDPVIHHFVWLCYCF